MSERIAKVNSLIAEKMNDLILREVDFKPGVLVTLVKVKTTKDLRRSDIHISVFPAAGRDYALKTLEHELSRLQRLLHKQLVMKVLPKIKFVYNDTEERAAEVEEIFKRLNEEK